MKRAGKDLTVVTYGACAVQSALTTADALEKETGMSVEVIDLRTIAPLDWETVFMSVRKTRRAVVYHEANMRGGVGNDIVRCIQEECYSKLRAPVKLLGAQEYPLPSAYVLEWDRLPYEEKFDEEDISYVYSTKLFALARELIARY